MTASARDTFTELIDPACVADTFAEGFGEVELIGGSCVRVTLFATRSVRHGARERIVVARLVLPEFALTRGLRQCAAVLSGVTAVDEETPTEGGCH